MDVRMMPSVGLVASALRFSAQLASLPLSLPMSCLSSTDLLRKNQRPTRAEQRDMRTDHSNDKEKHGSWVGGMVDANYFQDAQVAHRFCARLFVLQVVGIVDGEAGGNGRRRRQVQETALGLHARNSDPSSDTQVPVGGSIVAYQTRPQKSTARYFFYSPHLEVLPDPCFSAGA